MARAIDYKLLLQIVEEGYKMKPYPFDVDGMPAQCGMKIVYELSYASAKDQARALARFLFHPPNEEVRKNPDTLLNIEHISIAQILLSDVVETRRGTLDPNIEFYATKKVSMRRRTAGPVSMNTNSGNYIRHYTITPDMICAIYNSKYDQ